MFDIASQTSLAAFGALLPYTQSGVEEEFKILIERNLEVMDDHTGAAQYINAAVYSNSDFPFDEPLDGDQIVADGRAWRVLRKVSDDGFVSTVEIR